jgi:hypothetical protein
MIIPKNEGYWTWLAIPEMKANDVKNLDIGISGNIPRYYGKKNWLAISGWK